MAYSTPQTWTSGQIVTAADMNRDVRDNFNAAFPLGVDGWTAYTPSLTASSSNPTLGTGSTAAGVYIRIGRLIIGNARVAFGTSGTAAGTGTYRVSLPVTPRNYATTPPPVVGGGWIYDASANSLWLVSTYIGTGTSYVELPVEAGLVVTEAAPFAWSTSDQITFNFMYEAAS